MRRGLAWTLAAMVSLMMWAVILGMVAALATCA